MSDKQLSKNNNQRLKLYILFGVLFGGLLSVAIWMFAKNNLVAGIASLIIPIPVYFFYLVFTNPRLSFIFVLFFNYFAIGISRYLPAPLGLTVDAMLVLTWISLIFYQFNHKVHWENAAKDYTLFVVIWAVMTFLQLFNPEAVSREAWFYAMRAYALYSVLTVPVVYLIFNKPKDLELFVKLFAWFTVVAIIKALMQKFIGPDYADLKWLSIPGNRSTHLLFGQLRVFSIFSDAGNFGGSMGFAMIVLVILGINEKKLSKKLFYLIVGFAAFYALIISGTRSAIAVPLVGFFVYAILIKKIRILLTIGLLLFLFYFVLKYTTIGQNNYDIRRMRSAFSEDNASMNVRYENRRLFAEYLKTRPFGGGVGSAGNWGMRFTPDTFLAQTATDGWFIQIWAEQGVVGLVFYSIMILYIMAKSCFLIFFRLKKPEHISFSIAFVSGLAGVIISSYTASTLGQMPNTIIVFTSMTLISLMPEWEKNAGIVSLK